MELSFPPSSTNGVCLASFNMVSIYQGDCEASNLAEGTFQNPPLNMQLPVRHASRGPEQQRGAARLRDRVNL